MENNLELLANYQTIERAKKIQVKAIKRIDHYIVAITSSLTNIDEFHVCSIDAKFGSRVCNCLGSHKSFCSHLIAMVMALPELEMKDLITEYVTSVGKGNSMDEEILKELEFIPTSLKAFNTQIGGLARRTLTNICGEPGAGKSILISQLCYEWAVQNPTKNILYVGTEGGEEYVLKGWAIKAFNKRYNITPNIVKVDNLNLDYKQKTQSIFLFYETKILNLLEVHGFPLDLKVGKGGKITPIMDLPIPKKQKYADFPAMEDSLIGKFMKENNIGMIVYDSISMPNRVFISGQVNLPGRANVQELWFAQMQDAAKTNNAVIIASTHITKDDTNQFDMGKPLGGLTVAHNFKIALRVARYLNPRSKLPAQNPNLINKRKLVRERFFFEKCGKQAGITALDLSDEGYKDVDIIPIEEEDKDEKGEEE